jgi:hypothetical protein|tara:strand:- start:178 stop:399 length:222 start_codon:yes stop_codon:yes gene_type:complete
MLDQDTLRPVVIAMALYLALAILTPRIIKKPTGVKFIDEIVMSFIAQRGSLMSGTIIIGLVVLGTNYIEDEFL